MVLHEYRGAHADYFLSPAEQRPPDRAAVPLCVVISWLDTPRQWQQPKAVAKASRTAALYTERGCDVLFLQLRIPHHVTPALTRPAVRELLDLVLFLLQQAEPEPEPEPAAARALRPLLFHVFSGGCYLFGEMLGMLTAPSTDDDGTAGATAQHAAAVAGSICGLFADSPVRAADMPRGLAALLSGNLSLRRPAGPMYWLLRAAITAGLALAHPLVGRHLAAASRRVEALPRTILELAAQEPPDGSAGGLAERLLGVVVFSEDDRVADADGVRRTLEGWAAMGLGVRQAWTRIGPEPDGSDAPLVDEAELASPSDAAGWEMAVLQLARSAHAAHLRVHRQAYEDRLAWLVRGVKSRL